MRFHTKNTLSNYPFERDFDDLMTYLNYKLYHNLHPVVIAGEKFLFLPYERFIDLDTFDIVTPNFPTILNNATLRCGFSDLMYTDIVFTSLFMNTLDLFQ